MSVTRGEIIIDDEMIQKATLIANEMKMAMGIVADKHNATIVEFVMASASASRAMTEAAQARCKVGSSNLMDLFLEVLGVKEVEK